VPIESLAAVLRTPGEAPRLERVVLRDPGPGEVLLRILAAGVCHTDVAHADGELDYPLPVVLGHEGCGVVEAVGSGVTAVSVGDRVVLNLAPGCGSCRQCLLGRPIHCSRLAAVNGGLPTGPTPILGEDGPIAAFASAGCFARHAVVAERTAVTVPETVSDDVAAVIGCAVVTGFGAAVSATGIAPGSRGVVIGAGGVGASAILGARTCGATEVLVLDPSGERRERACSLGATAAVDPHDERAIEKVRTAEGHGLEWAVVCVGDPDALRLAVDLVGPCGMVTLVGLIPEETRVDLDWLDIVNQEKRIRGSAYGSRPAEILIDEILRLYAEGRLPLDQVVTHRLSLGEIDTAFGLARDAVGLRSVLLVSAAEGPQ
jgi:Zn-dependent alcohol dehydrogenase